MRPRPFYHQDVVQQMEEIGVKSLGIVLLTGFFTGMVLALQSSVALQRFGATMYVGSLVSGSIMKWFAPFPLTWRLPRHRRSGRPGV